MSETVKEIEIIGSLNEDNWYAKCIGQRFAVIDPVWWKTFAAPDDCYYVEHPENDDDTVCYVLINDCKVTKSVAQSAINTTEQPSKAAAVQGFEGILTEEELKERNRLLVLENDELNAENMKLKDELKSEIHRRESAEMSCDYAWMLNKQMNEINSEYLLKIRALEELK